MKSKLFAFSFLAVLVAAVMVSLVSADRGGRDSDDDDDAALSSDSRVERGLQISPVQLTFTKKRGLVGLGSYLVNAGGACADCHTCPTYDPGHNPYKGGDGRINPRNYLAGGVHFGPFTSANLTPDLHGLPAGMTREQFIQTIRTGRDHEDPSEILQVMPWPVYRNLTDRDLKAIYAYLSAIPHAEPGICGGAGE